MTAPARRTAPATAPQAPEDRRYFPAPFYGRQAPTLPPDEPVPGEIEPWEAVTAVRPTRPMFAPCASSARPATSSPPSS